GLENALPAFKSHFQPAKLIEKLWRGRTPKHTRPPVREREHCSILCDDGIEQALVCEDAPQVGQSPAGHKEDHDLTRPRFLDRLEDGGIGASIARNRSIVVESQCAEFHDPDSLSPAPDEISAMSRNGRC